MPELLVCPRCGSHNYFKGHSKKIRECYFFNCGHQFKFSDRLYALKKASKLNFKKLAFEADINYATFKGLRSGRFTPSQCNIDKIQILFVKRLHKNKKM